MFFRAKGKGKDPEMLRIEEQMRLLNEAQRCEHCDDTGVKVDLYVTVHNPDTPKVYHRKCPCGAEVHPKLAKYVEGE